MGKSTFQQKLQRHLFQFVLLFLLAFSLVFGVFLLAYSYGSNYFRTRAYRSELVQAFDGVYGRINTYLMEEETCRAAEQIIDGEMPVNNFAYGYKSLMRELNVSGDMILTGRDNRIAYASDTVLWSQQQHAFNTILQENLEDGALYHTVFHFTNLTTAYSRLVFARRVTDGAGTVKGVLCIYLDCDSYIKELASERYTAIVTFPNGNVIGSSSPGLLQNNHKFPQVQGPTYTNNGQHFWIASAPLGDGDMLGYVLLYDFPLDSYLILGFAVLLIILVLFLSLSVQFSKKLAAEHSVSVQTIHAELDRMGREARSSNAEYRIALSSGDEFEEIAAHINALLAEIQEIHARNLELVRLNGIMEVRQLEAQFNPHFLYNTLESIRCGVILGEKGIDDMILRLTELLRYSIDPSRQEVLVNDDIYYLREYLEIIHYRFGSRLSYRIDVDEACQSCRIPKLLLQPVVENSVKYGFGAKPSLRIRIRLFLEEGALIAEVEDDGPGMAPEELERVRGYLTRPAGAGPHRELQSICRRLRLMYGGDSGLELFSQAGQGTTVRCRIRESGER